MSSDEALVYRNYTQSELDAQYDTAVPLGGSPEAYFERFRAASAAARMALPIETLHYGANERETVDVVGASQRGSSLFFWIHGGYWRRMSKDDFTFAALPACEAGSAAAIVNYPLAPQATLDEIVASVCNAYAFVLTHAERLGFDRRRVVVGGHSVGAQLAGMLAARFPLQGVLGLSGLYDLEPIRRSKINQTIAMDAAAAQRNSPILHRPRLAAPLVLTCGEREQPEFQRQQREYAEAWRTWGGTAQELPAPGHDHFSLVLDLIEPQSTVTRALAALLARPAGDLQR